MAAAIRSNSVPFPLSEPVTKAELQPPSQPDEVETLEDDQVLIAGGGPVGLLLATVLAFYGVRCVLLERNETTTRWPKMDLTNARSMEMFRRLGLADSLRAEGVPSHIPQPVLFSTGLSEEKAITSWAHPSVDEYRENIKAKNDGSMPLEPWQRLSQAVFEKWLKSKCDENPLVDTRFGWKVESAEELDDGARLTATKLASGEKRAFVARYLVGCDGASSRVRRSLSIPLDGGPVPGYMHLIHFKSRDLSRLQKQGQFWHIFFFGEQGYRGAIIAQDEVDTWTTHLSLPLDVDHSAISSHDSVYTVLGGAHEKYEIKIDEILVRSTYRPSIAVARNYQGPKGRIYLAGDAAHQNIPTGGYGMNMGLADAEDIGWKLAMVLKKQGGKGLLASYEGDRRPVALMSIERSGVHMQVHMAAAEIMGKYSKRINDDTEECHQVREQIREHYRKHDGENRDLGIEMGYRYASSITLKDEDPSGKEPEWLASRYVPSTWPGARAPHVFLSDGTPIFNHYGKYFTLVEFADESDRGSEALVKAAAHWNLPLKHIRLANEHHVQKIWEKRLVLVRPDGHVSWRADSVEDLATARDIIAAISGFSATSAQSAQSNETLVPAKFSATTGTKTQSSDYKLENMGEFQQ